MASSSTRTTKPSQSRSPPHQPPKKRRKDSRHHISKPPASRNPTVNPYPRTEMPQHTSWEYPECMPPVLPCYELTPIMEEYMETMKEFSSGCPQINVLDPSSAFFTEWRYMSEFEEEDAGEVVEQATPALEDIDVWQYIEPDAEVLA